MLGRQRYLTLEAMRGAAALCVVLMHGPAMFGAASPEGAYLAVDFFFLLSGFIMAHVYGDALNAGLGGWQFLRIRLLRLYPLYLAGTLSTVGLATASIVFRHDGSLWAYCQPLISLPFALWILPSPAADQLYPLNMPAWTLMLELIANAAFAWGAWRRAVPLIATSAGACVALLLFRVSFGTLDLGWSAQTAAGGLARVFLGFPLGVLAYRARGWFRAPAWLGAAAPVLLVLCLFVRPAGSDSGLAYDLAFLAVGSPLLLLAGASREPAGPMVAVVYGWLGAISYPLYILHHPIERAADGMLQRHVAPGVAFDAAALGLLVVLILGAWVAAALDSRLRSGLMAKQRRRIPVTAEHV